MQLVHPFARSALCAGIALAVSACAMNADGSFKKDEQGNFVIDEKAKAALVGAAAGCAVGVASGHDCVKGAVVGAVAGFLLGWYFESKKLADAAQVNAEYARSRQKPPRNDIVPAAFNSQIEQKPADNGQTEVAITSSTDLIGYGDKSKLQVSQHYALYDANGKLLEEKTEPIKAVDGAGRYQTVSKFKTGAEQKGATVKTELVVNGKAQMPKSYKVARYTAPLGGVQLALAY